jgi:hypothetical protein
MAQRFTAAIRVPQTSSGFKPLRYESNTLSFRQRLTRSFVARVRRSGRARVPEVAEKLEIRIRVCLQAYRKSRVLDFAFRRCTPLSYSDHQEIGKGTSFTPAVRQPKRMRLSAAEVGFMWGQPPSAVQPGKARQPRHCPMRPSAAKEWNGAAVTAKSDEMTLPAVLKTRESPWQEDNNLEAISGFGKGTTFSRAVQGQQ